MLRTYIPKYIMVDMKVLICLGCGGSSKWKMYMICIKRFEQINRTTLKRYIKTMERKSMENCSIEVFKLKIKAQTDVLN